MQLNFFSKRSPRFAAIAHFTALQKQTNKPKKKVFANYIHVTHFLVRFQKCSNKTYNSSYFGNPKYVTFLLMVCELKHISAQQRFDIFLSLGCLWVFSVIYWISSKHLNVVATHSYIGEIRCECMKCSNSVCFQSFCYEYLTVRNIVYRYNNIHSISK